MSDKFHRCLGLDLSGVKSDRSVVATLDHYQSSGRLILADLEPRRLRETDELSSASDRSLVDSLIDLSGGKRSFSGLGVHGPLDFPPYLKKDLSKDTKADWYEENSNNEVKWMRETWEKLEHKPRAFSPYLQRPCEIWLRYVCREHFAIGDAMGSNSAPLAARLSFLKAYFPKPVYEVYPRATLARIVSSLGLPKMIVKFFSDVERGIEAREELMKGFARKTPQLFIYDKDFETLIVNQYACQAFLAALTIHLLRTKQCEERPAGFPKKAMWIEIPRPDIKWDEVF